MEILNMRKYMNSILLLSVVLFITASASAADLVSTQIKPGLPENWKLAGPAALTTNLILSSQKYQNALPLEISYSFKDGEGDYVFVESKMGMPGKPKRLRGAIYGDGSGNSLRANFSDSSGEFFQFFVAKIDWSGWKDIEVDLILTSHWDGNNNNILDGEITFLSWGWNAEKGRTKSKSEIALGPMTILSEGVQKPGEAPAAGSGAKGQIRVTIDDFERANPLAVYSTWRGDDSTIDSVSATEFKKEGNYSMQVTYRLSTSRSVPSWSSLSYTPERSLDWTKVDQMQIWVKGDGTKNILQFSLTDQNNGIWLYRLPDALKKVEWQQITIPLAHFRDQQWAGPYNPGMVKQYEILVIGEQAQVSSGKFWLDELTVSGKGLDPLVVSPRPPVTQEAIDKNKIGFGDFMHMEHRQTPELGSQFLFYNSLYVRGTSKKLSVSADLVARQNEAGSSIGFRRPQEQAAGQKDAATEVVETRNPIELAYISANLHDIHSHISQITVGNINVDYGRDVFSPVFGFKGIEGEGRIQMLHYDAFIIKHAFDSYTFGYRFQGSYLDTLLKHEVVHHRDTAKVNSNAQIKDGALVVTGNNNLTTEPVGNDTVYYFEADHDFLGAVNLNAQYGMDFFQRDAIKDVTDPFNPVINQKLLNPVSLYGTMWQVKAKILQDVLFRGFFLIGSYRDMSGEYKPRFRFDPGFYDDFFADQRGYKFEAQQIVGHCKFTSTYDSVDRGPKGSGYRRWYSQSTIGYYDLNRLDVVFAFNKRREIYALGENYQRSTFFITPLDPRDEETEAYELFLGNWFTNAFYLWCKMTTNDIRLVRTSKKLRNDRMQIQGEYAFASNAKVFLSVIRTRYDDRTAEPFGGDPPTDNVVRLFLDINF